MNKSTDPEIEKIRKSLENLKNYNFPTLNHKLKKVKESPYRFINKDDNREYVLAITWSDWADYCKEPNNKIERNQNSKWIPVDASKIQQKFCCVINDFCIQKDLYSVPIIDATYIVLVEDLLEKLSSIKLHNLNQSDIKKILQINYGFPLSHKTSNFFSFIFVPTDNICRPAIPYGTNEDVVRLSADELTNRIDVSTGNEKYHYIWLKKHINSQLEAYNTTNWSTATWDDIKSYPFTGNGYTLNWENIDNIDTDNESLYGFTEFIVRSPNMTPKNDNRQLLENKIIGYTIGDECNWNEFKELLEYLVKLQETQYCKKDYLNVIKDKRIVVGLFVLGIIIMLIVIIIMIVRFTRKDNFTFIPNTIIPTNKNLNMDFNY